MNDTRPSTIMDIITESIATVAPDVVAEVADLDPGVDLWHELELDSMDHLSVMEQLATRTGRDIPEADYPKLISLDQIREYLVSP